MDGRGWKARCSFCGLSMVFSFNKHCTPFISLYYFYIWLMKNRVKVLLNVILWTHTFLEAFILTVSVDTRITFTSMSSQWSSLFFSFVYARRRNLHWTATRLQPGWVRVGLKRSLQRAKIQTQLRHAMPTDLHGTLRSSTCWHRWGSAWASGTCGGSRTFATKMEVVSVFFWTFPLCTFDRSSLQDAHMGVFDALDKHDITFMF